MIPRHDYDKPFRIIFPDRSEWKEGFQSDRKGGIIWYTDGSETNKDIGAGVYFMVIGRNLVLALGSTQQYSRHKCTPLRHAQLRIYVGTTKIGTSAFATIKALGKHQITSKLVWDFHQSLIQLAKHNRVQLKWVPCHEDIVGNETADQLARTGPEHPFIRPEPACGTSIGVAKEAVKDWTNRNHKKTLEIRN
jgi:hypothetical protein